MARHHKLTASDMPQPATYSYPPAPPLLAFNGLSVSYGTHQVINDVSFVVERGTTVAVIGESGSGKSTIVRSLLRVLPDNSTTNGEILFEGNNLLTMKERAFRPLRGRVLGFVPQDPNNSLNPVKTIGAQADEAARLLEQSDKHLRKQRVLESFEQVGLVDPEQVYAAYPHQLSGGMLQRVLIALAILPRPALLVADEPTSALDVTIQKRILDLLKRLQRELNISLLLITHDLAIAAERADALVVLRHGNVEEAGPTRQVFNAPASSYARRLHDDAPALAPERFAELRQAGFERVADSHRSHVIRVNEACKRFGEENTATQAVNRVSFKVKPGTTHALVGESGSGKTTTARMLLGLEQPDSGSIEIAGQAVGGRSPRELRELRRHLQLIYQNPFTSLDPHWTVARLVREPLDRYRIGPADQRRQHVHRALERVGLDTALLERKPGSLSGGQRQRVAIARALVLEPDILVLDEPTSALDVSVQADIINTLLELQATLGLTYIFVSHDLALVHQFAHTVSVMRQGTVVEQGLIDDVFNHPQETYTQSLLASIPKGHQAASEHTTHRHEITELGRGFLAIAV